MELFLNSIWVLLASAGLLFWLGVYGRGKTERRISFVALVMLIVILFPVISVSDDLWSIQNPAEPDTHQRRHQLAFSPNSIFPAITAPPEPAFVGLTFGFRRISAPLQISLLSVSNPAFDSVENRPPPAS